VGFYQVMKIAVAPTVILIEAALFGKIPPVRIVASVLVVCLGIGIATITDSELITNIYGLLVRWLGLRCGGCWGGGWGRLLGRLGPLACCCRCCCRAGACGDASRGWLSPPAADAADAGPQVGVAATVMTALYQIWAGSKQKELRASSMQLLHQYTPQAALMLAVLIPMAEPLGLSPASRSPETIIGFPYGTWNLLAILLSAALGLLVSLSTFLVIGATSSLTYNVVGHLKTIIILSGGCMFFGDSMPYNKLMGVCVAMGGIVWYTQLKLQAAGAANSKALTAKGSQNGHAADAYEQHQQQRQLLPTTHQHHR
jgi:hypothetical protein